MTAPDDIKLNDQHFAKLKTIIHDNTGITIGDGRRSMLLSRLRSRLRETKEPGFKSYIDRVSNDAQEMQELIDRVTTNKTYFYRTPRVWNHFRTNAVQAFQNKKTSRPMRIWSAASSSGEEAHTVGIVLEQVRNSETNFDYKIIGSDISSRVIKQAERGVYASKAVAQFRKDQPDLFRSHMIGDDSGGFQVGRDIKSRISFKQHNLQNRMRTTGSFDVVFLRNVLIYFSPEDQEGILRNIHANLVADGTLYIGESETLTRLKTDFEMVEPMVYRPKSNTSRTDA